MSALIDSGELQDFHSAMLLAAQLAMCLDRLGAPREAVSLVPYIETVLAQARSRHPDCLPEAWIIKSSERLSNRESDILLLVARGMSNKRIANALTIAPETVKSHVKRIFIKLDVKTRAQAVSRAGALGTLDAHPSSGA